MAVRHPVTSDCIAHWRMDGAGSEADDSGTGLTLAVNGAAIPAVSDSPFGDGATSRDLSATGWGSSYFNCTSGLSVFDGLAAMTVSGWVKITLSLPQQANFHYPILWLRNGGANYMVYGAYRNAAPYESRNGCEFSVASSDMTVSSVLDLGWHLITAVHDGAGSGTLYLDAAVIATDASVSGVTATAAATTLECGNGSYSTTASFPGYISDLAIYNSAKDATWVSGVYNSVDSAGLSLVSLSLTHGAERGLKPVGSTRTQD